MLSLPIGLTILTFAGFYGGWKASENNVVSLSPQGCRMSWMSPSYVLQSDFDELWTTLSRRYSLWLYREVEWDTSTDFVGNPVLFIPGNAGSSHQARSIASSAARQFYSSPGSPDPSMEGLRPLDVFTVEFNEDLSAIHGPTLLTQTEYVSEAIAYILASYRPPRRRITLMGHSMGGIVARLALVKAHTRWNISDIAAVITMSAPNSLAPARVDSSTETIYHDINQWENSRSVEHASIIAICGGSTDSMIPSETCKLPALSESANSQLAEAPQYRRTVHTTSLLGIWSGVGHREMVWCHQVRWRVARAALELGYKGNHHSVAHSSFEKWFSPSELITFNSTPPEMNTTHLDLGMLPNTVVTSATLRVPNPALSPHVYLLPIPRKGHKTSIHRFALLVSRGTVHQPSLANQLRQHHSGTLRVSMFRCNSDLRAQSHTLLEKCQHLESPQPMSAILLPLPVGDSFPHKEGVDESDVLTFVTAPVDVDSESSGWIAVRVEGGTGNEWITGGFDRERVYDAKISNFGLFFRSKSISLSHFGFTPLKTLISINLSPSSLLVYRAQFDLTLKCGGDLLPSPLIHFIPSGTTNSTESQFFSPNPSKPDIYLASHSTGPYLPESPDIRSSSSLIIYSTGTCGVNMITIGIDWKSFFGRAAIRYWTAIPVYMVGIVSFAISIMWRHWETADSEFQDPTFTLMRVTTHELPICGTFLTFLAVLPLPKPALLGNGGELILAGLPAICLFLACGATWISWAIMISIVRVISFVRIRVARDSKLSSEPFSPSHKALLGAPMILFATFLFPVQLLYLASLIRHIWRCSRPRPSRSTKVRMSPPPGSIARGPQEVGLGWRVAPLEMEALGYRSSITSLRAQQLHVLLLISVMFPLVGSSLVVWVRTLQTAGITAPFPGDHNIFRILFIICLVESTDYELPQARSRKTIFLGWVPFSILAAFSFLLGPRFSYGVPMMANFISGILLVRMVWIRRAQ